MICISGTTMQPLVSEIPTDPVTPGAKIWLVPSDMLCDDEFVAWEPSRILFEGIGLPDHCYCPK